MSTAIPCDGTGRRILAAANECGALDKDVARWCGVDPSQVSHWRDGSRAMPVWVLRRIAKFLDVEGARKVFDELLGPAGLHAVVDEPVAAVNPLTATIECNLHIVQIQRAIAQAQSDGVIQPGEAADIHRRCGELTAMLGQVKAGVRAAH